MHSSSLCNLVKGTRGADFPRDATDSPYRPAGAEQILEMGAEEGMIAAMGQIDDLLAAEV